MKNPKHPKAPPKAQDRSRLDRRQSAQGATLGERPSRAQSDRGARIEAR